MTSDAPLTANERKSLSEQLVGNRLIWEILGKMESDAIEALVYAKTEQERVESQWRVRSVRTFQSDCKASLRSTRTEKGDVA